SAPVMEGQRRRGRAGVVRSAAGPPVRDPVASCPLWQGGQIFFFPLLVEEGWREATGWWARPVPGGRGPWKRAPPAEEGQRRRGRPGVVRSAAGPPVRDPVASCPPSQGGQIFCFPLLVEEGWREATGWWARPVPGGRGPWKRSPPAKEGQRRRGRPGVVRGAAGPPVRDPVASCPPWQGGQIF